MDERAIAVKVVNDHGPPASRALGAESLAARSLERENTVRLDTIGGGNCL